MADNTLIPLKGDFGSDLKVQVSLPHSVEIVFSQSYGNNSKSNRHVPSSEYSSSLHRNGALLCWHWITITDRVMDKIHPLSSGKVLKQKGIHSGIQTETSV